jgi:alpha/beta superfamily hydrolase
VVFRAGAALNDAGLAVLRFNFRGVGQSSGVHDDGVGEQDDARVALDYLANRFPDTGLTLAGFSFGSRVGTAVGMKDPRVLQMISIGTPVDKYDFSFLSGYARPMLFVHGANDEFGRVEPLRELVAQIPQATLVVIPDCGHFFEGHLDELKQAIAAWMEGMPVAGSPVSGRPLSD